MSSSCRGEDATQEGSGDGGVQQADIEAMEKLDGPVKQAEVEVGVLAEPEPRRHILAPWVQSLLGGLADAAKEWLDAPAASLTSSSAAVEEDEDLCPICYAEPPTFALPCGHALCVNCAVRYVREALGDAQTQVFPQGVRCPMHSSGCEVFITSSEAQRLLSARDARCAYRIRGYHTSFCSCATGRILFLAP